MRYFFISWMNFKSLYVYRINAFMTIMYTFVNSIMVYFLWKAIFAENDMIGGFTFEQMITYVLMSLVISRFLFFFLEDYLSSKINDGSIITFLMKPMYFPFFAFYEKMGESIFRLLTAGIPTVLLAIFAYNIKITMSGSSIVFFIITLLYSWTILFCVQFLFGVFVIYVVQAGGLWRLRMSIIAIFSGEWMPLDLYPLWLRNLVVNLPFKIIYYYPLTLLTNKENLMADSLIVKLFTINGVSKSISILLEMSLWLFILIVVCILLWRTIIKRLSIQGG